MGTKSAAVGVIGIGLVGSSLVRMIDGVSKKGKFQINIVAMATSQKMLLSSSQSPLNGSGKKEVEERGVKNDLELFKNHVISQAGKVHVPVIIDCTSNENIGQMYPSWLRAGVSIVTPNKKAFSSDYKLFEEIASLKTQVSCYHESTVGAGLPIVASLQDMMDSGDELVKIEGIFSGTLSYLFNTFASDSCNMKFSEVVLDAKSKGYTEPDPRDDLNGMDMARKIVILGRIGGLKLSLETLEVENIVPEPLRKVETAEEFLQKLPSFDSHFDKMKKEASQRGEVLRYVGVIDPKGKSSVKLNSYPKSHGFGQLKGSDNIVMIQTKNWQNPFVIQGAGAGDDVTSFGIMADLFRLLRP